MDENGNCQKCPSCPAGFDNVSYVLCTKIFFLKWLSTEFLFTSNMEKLNIQKTLSKLENIIKTTGKHSIN